MRIKALKPFDIGTDGIGYQITKMKEGDSIDAAEDIAAGLIAEGYAEAVVEEKKVVSAPENKAIKAAPSNKKKIAPKKEAK